MRPTPARLNAQPPLVPACRPNAACFTTAAATLSSAFRIGLVDYELVLQCLKKLPAIAVQDKPYRTRRVVQNFGKEWASDEEVDELLTKLPQHFQDALLPFQHEGVRFGLRRRGRCLIADEMGLGKTLQILLSACPKFLALKILDNAVAIGAPAETSVQFGLLPESDVAP